MLGVVVDVEVPPDARRAGAKTSGGKLTEIFGRRSPCSESRAADGHIRYVAHQVLLSTALHLIQSGELSVRPPQTISDA